MIFIMYWEKLLAWSYSIIDFHNAELNALLTSNAINAQICLVLWVPCSAVSAKFAVSFTAPNVDFAFRNPYWEFAKPPLLVHYIV